VLFNENSVFAFDFRGVTTMPDNYQNAFEEACELVDAGRADSEALALAADHYRLTPTEREQLTREWRFLDAVAVGGRRAEYDDAQAGLRWWNGLSEAERARWLACVPAATVAAAWRAFKSHRDRDA
jgi:hypothetical protein